MRFLHLYAAIFGWRVRGGPFRGTNYVRDSVCGPVAPKLLGSYEVELNDWIERLLERKFATVLNIGAAEGYYAVGFARRSPRTRVVAFESEASGRALLAKLAAINRVADRIVIEGICTRESLRSHLDHDQAPLLIVDIEGGEFDLLDPQKLPELRRCAMLIEVHKWGQSTPDILRARFASSHAIEERWTRSRTLDDLPASLRLIARIAGSSRFLRALNEQRPGPMCWFLCQPRLTAA